MRKILTIFTIVAFACIPMVSSASVVPYDGTITVESRTVEPGESFTVEVYLDGNDMAISSLRIPLEIDDSYLTCTNVDFTGALNGTEINGSYTINGSEISIYYTSPLTFDPIPTFSDVSGLLATLHLVVDQFAPEVDAIIDSLNDDLSFDQNGLYFSRWDRIEFTNVDGTDILVPGFTAGVTSISVATDIADESESLLPETFGLSQNFPNPFNPTTMISFDLPVRAKVCLKVFNLLGQNISTLADGDFEAGRHEIMWNAERSPSGIYFYRLTTDSKSITRKMALLK